MAKKEKDEKEYSGLGLLDGFYAKVFEKAERRAASPVDPARESRESNSGIFYELQGGGLVNAVEPVAEMEQAERLFDDAEGMLVVETLDFPAERARGFAALALLKRQAGFDPDLAVREARGALERIPLDAAFDRARAMVEIARPGAGGKELDRAALKRAEQQLSGSFDCPSAGLRSEIAALLHAAGDDAGPAFAAAKKVLSAPSAGVFASTLARVAAKEAQCGLDAEPTFRKARVVLDTTELAPAEYLGVCADFVGFRADAGQLEVAHRELAEIISSTDPAAAGALMRAWGLLGAAIARGGDVQGAQAVLAEVPRRADAETASAAIEALALVSRTMAERGYSHAAQRMRDAAMLVLKQLQQAGINELTETAIEALAISLASCGSSADAQSFASAAGGRAVPATVEVALATARAAARLMQEARTRRRAGG